MCSPICFYSSSFYHQARGTCCTGAFVDRVIFPLHTQIIEKGRLSEGCTRAIERVACFACARDQSSFLSFEWDKSDLANSEAEIRICRKTCHTIYEHCKDDPFFHIGESGKVVSEEFLCNILDTEITLELAKEGTKINVQIVDGHDAERPECFMYDDLEPDPDSYDPKPLVDVNPGTNHYSVVFNERMRRAPSLGSEDRKGETVVSLRRMGDKKEVASIKGADAANAIQIVTTNTLDDTVQIVFPADEATACMLDASGDKVKYDLIIMDDVVEDMQGNAFHGLQDAKWQFSTNGDTTCVSNANADVSGDGGLGNGPSGLLLAAIIVSVLTVLGAFGFVYFRRKRDAAAYASQVDFGDDMVLEPNTKVEEGTTVTTKSGEKFQVRLVPEYDPSGVAAAAAPAEVSVAVDEVEAEI
jgi:hypothetical protein